MNYTYKYTVIGIAFGWAFVFAAWLIDLFVTSLVPTPANIIQIHIDNPVIYIVDTAPLVLGTIFYYLGKLYQRLYNQSSERQSSTARFKVLMDSAFDAIIVMDEHGRVLDFNAAAETIFGYKSQNVVGKVLSELIIPHRYRKAHTLGLETFLKTGVGPIIGQRVEIEALHHDGHEFPVEVSIANQFILAGDASGAGFIGFVRDITERKKAAAQIIQSSKLATLGEMATSVAHELNQPLNVIRMAAANGRRKISNGTADLEYLNDKLERIEEQTARAAAIIDHMRMFGREA
ncbi:MAG: PAS domain S-box-containing protein, partial [Gammaproteobacteria bacterium]